MSTQVSDSSNGYEFTLVGVADILSDLNTAYANSIRAHVVSGNLREAVEAPFPDPRGYTCAELFRKDYLAYNLLRKSDLDLGVDRRAAAVTAFLESEETCALINTYGRNPYVFDRAISGTSLEALIFNARKLIGRLLGNFSWDLCEEHIGFSGGASTRHPRRSGSPFYKFQGNPDVTPACQALAIADVMNHPLWMSHLCERGSATPKSWHNLVVGSRADTVPKTWKTDRFICIEPDANMRLQRGIGGAIRKLLRKRPCGIDLRDQTYNQKLACIGSRTGSLSTIDLKAASDSIAIELVRDLLPYDWFEALMVTRSHYTQIEGKWVKLEKMSSMGNGFTFELETLIFWALGKSVLEAYAVEDQRLAVYGDDIVIHNSAAEPLIELLSYVGFTTNTDKTFVRGPFRESCGKHYFLGVDVSPFNIKSKVDSESRFYWLMNSYNEWIRRSNYVYPKGAKRIYRRGRKFARTYCVVPPGYGYDSGIETPADRASVVWSMRRQQYVFKTLRAVRRVHRPNGTPALLYWLSVNRSDSISEDILELHKGETVYQRFSAATSRWGHFAP